MRALARTIAMHATTTPAGMRTADTYSSAVAQLNSLQSNSQIIDEVRKHRDLLNKNSIRGMDVLLSRANIAKEPAFRTLKCIHVVGTKGKGSCAAACESILRSTTIIDNVTGQRRPLRTGLFTSPHLIEARERIRINGQPMARSLLAKYITTIHARLDSQRPTEPSIIDPVFPAYFRFLTLVAFEAFVQEKVDVAIFEAGIGGEYDSTNILSPIVTGITALGIDHLNLLGPGIKDISWHKAGAMKSGRPAYSIVQDSEEATEVLKARAEDLGASKLTFVQPDEIQSRPEKVDSYGLDAKYQLANMSVAVNLCDEWIKNITPRVDELAYDNGMESLPSMDEVRVEYEEYEGEDLRTPTYQRGENWAKDISNPPTEASGRYKLEYTPEVVRQGLMNVKWPGRAQTYKSPEFEKVTFFLDGAHTKESIPVCVEWFETASKRPEFNPKDTGNEEDSSKRILIFNCTKGRDAYVLLESLVDLHFRYPFDKVIFSGIDCFKASVESSKDSKISSTGNGNNSSNNSDTDSAISSMSKNQERPDKKLRRSVIPVDQQMNSSVKLKMLVPQELTESDWKRLVDEKKAKLVQAGRMPEKEIIQRCSVPTIRTSSIEESIELAATVSEYEGVTTNVLVTGSLYLVGGVLTVLNAPVV